MKKFMIFGVFLFILVLLMSLMGPGVLMILLAYMWPLFLLLIPLSIFIFVKSDTPTTGITEKPSDFNIRKGLAIPLFIVLEIVMLFVAYRYVLNFSQSFAG